MSIQVSAVPEQTGLSNAAKLRIAFFEHVLGLAQRSRSKTAWLKELSDRAAILLQDQTFPTARDEEWRFTDLSELVQFKLESATPSIATRLEQIAAFVLPEAEQTRLVFVDGSFAPELSSTLDAAEGLVVGNLASLQQVEDKLRPYLAQQPGAEEIFTALNTIALADGAVVIVPKNLQVEKPIHLLFVSTTGASTFTQPRCLVIAEPSSAVTLIEDYVALGEGTYFTNSVTEIFVEENAQVVHNRLQRDSATAFHIGKTVVSQGRYARYTCNAISLGAKLARHTLNVHPNGEQAEVTLNGLTFIGGEQLSDTHSAIALSKPHCTTRQLHKCIVDDRAHAVFNGKVFVPKAAQLTDAGQLNRNLLLSPKARVDTKPQLEIVADNVKCTHGATVSQLESDEIFYLQSRGIDAASAQKLLVYAFAYEVINKIPVESLKNTLSAYVKKRNQD